MKRRIVFAGDSIIHGGPWQYWLPEYYVTNFAFPGHTNRDLAALIDNIVESQPEVLVVMIGTNDFGKYRLPVEEVIENILSNARALRNLLPGIPILWNSLSPRSDEFSEAMIQVNEAIKPVLQELKIQYFDAFALLKDPERNAIQINLCEDPDTFGLHLNNAGYEVWFKALAPEITSLLS